MSEPEVWTLFRIDDTYYYVVVDKGLASFQVNIGLYYSHSHTPTTMEKLTEYYLSTT